MHRKRGLHRRRSTPDNATTPFVESVDNLNAAVFCGWCHFPARVWSRPGEEIHAVLVKRLPGFPAHRQWAIHQACLSDFEASVAANTKGWDERIASYYIGDDPVS